MTAALQTGQVDAVATVPAAAIQMIDAGIGYEIQTANDPAVIRPRVGDILGAQGLTTTQDFIDRYPELTQAIVDAIHEGLRKVQEAGANADAVLAMFPDDVVEQLGDGFAAQWAYTLPAFVDVDSVITASEARATLDFQETYAGSDFSNVPDTFFDNTYALRSYDDLGLDEPADIPQYPLQG
jgi:ABC-type nitrate/sulfonate/bicarbonate transport system substrate-binding protein